MFVTVCLIAGMNPKVGLLTLSGDLPGFPFSSEKKALVEKEASLRSVTELHCWALSKWQAC
jgi:hypothetical protein